MSTAREMFTKFQNKTRRLKTYPAASTTRLRRLFLLLFSVTLAQEHVTDIVAAHAVAVAAHVHLHVAVHLDVLAITALAAITALSFVSYIVVETRESTGCLGSGLFGSSASAAPAATTSPAPTGTTPSPAAPASAPASAGLCRLALAGPARRRRVIALAARAAAEGHIAYVVRVRGKLINVLHSIRALGAVVIRVLGGTPALLTGGCCLRSTASAAPFSA